MLEAIEKLLILQDRDRRIRRLRGELANVGPERQAIESKLSSSQSALDTAKLRVKLLETERKKLELEVETQKQSIEKYALQQYQTKKNDEYRALAHEIQTAREAIRKLEDQQLEYMEQAETAQREGAAVSKVADEARSMAARLLGDLVSREENLKQELAQLESNREELAAAVDPVILPRYERLRKSKGESVVVGVAHGVCGGCHMRVTAQVLISCQTDQEIVTCPNCGRILYYTRDMSLAVAD
jgi:predicted  nucleic acid-binding Zn-ribbon protein